jgi:hypothetical protein
MRNVQQRLQALEQLPQFQPPPSQLEQIEDRAMHHISNEDLEVMITMATDLEAGVDRTISDRESEVVAALDAARETEARRMGFRSYKEAERKGR